MIPFNSYIFKLGQFQKRIHKSMNSISEKMRPRPKYLYPKGNTNIGERIFMSKVGDRGREAGTYRGDGNDKE